MDFLLDQLVLAFFNFVNALIDAARIKKHKCIYHGVNGFLYLSLTAFIILVSDYNWPHGILFTLASFFNRNIVFDGCLNEARGLSVFYQSTDERPKSIVDKIEKRLFKGWNGQDIFFFYVIMWGITIGIKLLWL